MTILQYLPLAMAVAMFTIYYFAPADRKSTAGLALRGAIAVVSTIMVAYLFHLFFDRNYGFKYVYENSNNGLTPLYRMSAVWAGQAGTLLLWYWMTAVILLLVRGQKAEHERSVFVALGSVMVMLGVFIAKISPFEMLPKAAVDGLGLNPLLVNPWMAIHPPMIFIGYALAVVPFAYALSGVVNKDFSGWGRAARPWALAAWAFLGVGVFLGSYWAYEVLGWGGYWSWDPVENASIFPWIVLGALVHGLIIQGNRQRFALWNIMLAFASAIMVVLATFLTRSGALSAFSVHSFEKSVLYVPLLISLASFIGLAVILSWMAASGLHAAKVEQAAPPLSSQLLSWTVTLLVVLLVFIVIGTLFPLISGLMLDKPTTVKAFFYNSTTSLVMIPFVALLLICPFVFIKKIKGVGAGVRYGLAALGAAVGFALAYNAFDVPVPMPFNFFKWLFSCVTYLSDKRHLIFIIISVAAGAAVFANVVNFYHFVQIKKWNIAAYITHIGVALAILGVITSTVGTKTSEFKMLEGNSSKFGNIEIRYTGTKPQEDSTKATLGLKQGQVLREVDLEFPQDPQRQMAKPVIVRSLAGDIYISPRSIEIVEVRTGAEGHSAGGDVLTVGQKQKVRAGAYELQLQDWRAGKGHQQMGSVTALVDVFDGANKKTIELPFSPSMQNRDEAEQRKLDDGTTLEIQSIDVTSHTAYIQVTPSGETPKKNPQHSKMVGDVAEVPGIIIDVSRKPFISILWWGMILIGIGTFLAILNRKSRPKAEQEQAG